MGKETFFLFPVQANFDGLFPIFLQNREKRMKRGLNGENGSGAVPSLSRSLNLGRFHFDSVLKPVLPSFFLRSWLFFPIQDLSCVAYHIEIRSTSSLTIGSRWTITSLLTRARFVFVARKR